MKITYENDGAKYKILWHYGQSKFYRLDMASKIISTFEKRGENGKRIDASQAYRIAKADFDNVDIN